MNTDNEKIIMENSDEAATYRTDICGWIDSRGQYYGKGRDAERTARYAGSTHKLCECGEVTPNKYYTKCQICRDKRAIEKYNKKEKKVWDEDSFIYSQKYDKYFDGIEELENFLNEYEEKDRPEIANMMLVHCDPQHMNEINIDYWSDLTADECDLPGEIIEALEDFNDLIRNQEPISWVPGNIAVENFEVKL